MTIILSRRRRSVCAPVAPAATGCTCALRHPCSVAERECLQRALAEASRVQNRDLVACLKTRLSTPCLTSRAAARLAAANWLEAPLAAGPLCPCGCGYPPEKHVQQCTPTKEISK